jgi:putative intracellular protease/amidase
MKGRERMSQKAIEVVIGRLVTDEPFRTRFETDPRATLATAGEAGLELTVAETSALLNTDPTLWGDVAGGIDPRLQRVRLIEPTRTSEETAMMSDTIVRRPSKPQLGGRHLLERFGIHPRDKDAVALDMTGTRALCIATNHAVLDVGVATGVFASELTVPYYCFLDAGMQVDVASPLGGVIPVDPLSMDGAIRTPDDDRMLGDQDFRRKLMSSLAIADIDFAAYDIIYFAGGWGAAFDLGQSDLLGQKVSDAWAAGRVIGGICHGPLGLLKGRTADGELIVKGRRLTAVTNKQIREVKVEITPLHPETALRQAGALYESKSHKARDFFANHYVSDGNLITGQNQNAGPMVARLMMQRVIAKQTASERKAS